MIRFMNKLLALFSLILLAACSSPGSDEEKEENPITVMLDCSNLTIQLVPATQEEEEPSDLEEPSDEVVTVEIPDMQPAMPALAPIEFCTFDNGTVEVIGNSMALPDDVIEEALSEKLGRRIDL